MERIITNNCNIMKQECPESSERYSISVRNKKNGYESRMTLKIVGGGPNPRITGYGSSVNEAVFKLIYNIKAKLVEYKQMNMLTQKTVLDIQESVVTSVKGLGICDEGISFEAASIFNVLTVQNETVNSFVNSESENISVKNQNQITIETKQIKPIKSKDFRTVGLEWFKSKLSLTIETEENVNPLSHRTVDGYYEILDRQLIPYFRSNKNISVITAEECKKCILSFNGASNKESVYFVLKMVFDYAKLHNYIYFLPNIYRPQKPKSKEEKEIICIEPEEQPLWIDTFEEESTDMSLLFETLLLEGLRPEERLWIEVEIYRF